MDTLGSPGGNCGAGATTDCEVLDEHSLGIGTLGFRMLHGGSWIDVLESTHTWAVVQPLKVTRRGPVGGAEPTRARRALTKEVQEMMLEVAMARAAAREKGRAAEAAAKRTEEELRWWEARGGPAPSRSGRSKKRF